jgi:hypothetical protein
LHVIGREFKSHCFHKEGGWSGLGGFRLRLSHSPKPQSRSEGNEGRRSKKIQENGAMDREVVCIRIAIQVGRVGTIKVGMRVGLSFGELRVRIEGRGPIMEMRQEGREDGRPGEGGGDGKAARRESDSWWKKRWKE